MRSRDRRLFRVASDEEHGLAPLLPEPRQRVLDAGARPGVERAKRLVEEQDGYTDPDGRVYFAGWDTIRPLRDGGFAMYHPPLQDHGTDVPGVTGIRLAIRFPAPNSHS